MAGAGLTTSTCGQEEPGIEPQTKRLAYKPLCLLRRTHPSWTNIWALLFLRWFHLDVSRSVTPSDSQVLTFLIVAQPPVLSDCAHRVNGV